MNEAFPGSPRQNESLPHCLLAPQPIAHSIKTEEIVLVLFCLLSCSTMLLAPSEWSLGPSVPFISSHRDKKPVASTPKKVVLCCSVSSWRSESNQDWMAFPDSASPSVSARGHSALLPGRVFVGSFHCYVFTACSAWALDPPSTLHKCELILKTWK